MSGMRERAARAMFDAANHQAMRPERHMTWDLANANPLHWRKSIEIAQDSADAVLAEVAEVGGIAEVLAAHMRLDFHVLEPGKPWTCRGCGATFAHALADLDAARVAHQAEAVAAYLLDRT